MEKEKMNLDCPEEIADLCMQIADNRKAEDIIRIDVREHTVIADFYVLCTGSSFPHINAISEHIGRELRNKYQLRPRAVEGTPESQWVLMDYISVVVHIMTPESRSRYELESLWGDAPQRELIEKLEPPNAE